MLKTITLFLSLIILSLSSCLNTRLSSKIDPDFNQKIDRIYVITKDKTNFRQFFEAITSDLKEDFGLMGILTKEYMIEPVELKTEIELEKYFSNQIKEFQPTVVLVMEEVSFSKSSEYNYTLKSDFKKYQTIIDIQLKNPERTKIHWRGNLVVSSTNSRPASQGPWSEKLAGKIIQKMKDDGLF